MVLHWLARRNLPAWSFYIKIGLVVLAIQVWFLLVFTGYVTSRDHRPQSPSVHYNRRDLANVTSLLDLYPRDLMIADDVVKKSVKRPDTIDGYVDPHPASLQGDSGLTAKPRQLRIKQRHSLYRQSHQAPTMNSSHTDSSINAQIVHLKRDQANRKRKEDDLGNVDRFGIPGSLNSQHYKGQRVSTYSDNLRKNWKADHFSEEEIRSKHEQPGLTDPSREVIAHSKNIPPNQDQFSTRRSQQQQQLWKLPSNIDHQQHSLKENAQHFSKKPSFENVWNVNNRQHLLPKTAPWTISKRGRHPDEGSRSKATLLSAKEKALQVQAKSDVAKKRVFFAHLWKRKEKTVLSPGCPGRGVANHVTSLAFVKVHKSASSTVANILARYALRYMLNVALPRKSPGTKRFNYFEPGISRNQVYAIPRGQQYQVVFNHMIFQRSDLEAFLPNGTFYFAITRDPWDRFVSSFTYYGYLKFLLSRYRMPSVKDAILLFIKHPGMLRNHTKPELYNSLAGDTGLSPRDHTDVRAVKAHIDTLEKDLQLVMIVEYFDESLVMLKRKACLSTRDIVYMVKNARSQPALTKVNLTPEERVMFNQFQMADVLMYQHFYQRFWEQVAAEGSDFFLEVRQFKEIQRSVIDFCQSARSPWDFLAVPRSAWNEEFLVTSRDCSLMGLSELTLQHQLIVRAVRLHRMGKANRAAVDG